MGTIKDLPFLYRPREKALHYGLASLSEVELLAIIIGKGVKDNSAIKIASELFTHFNGLTNIFNSTVAELSKFKGISKIKAIEILTIKELYLRAFDNKIIEYKLNVKLSCSKDIYNYTHLYFETIGQEEIIFFYLNGKNEVIYEEKFNSNFNDQVSFDFKKICKKAIEVSAKKIIFTHNHPSGDSSPSLEDYDVFIRLKEALKIIQVKLLDHIVIGKNEYYSIASENKYIISNN